ncbi:MAG: hypothetical protein J0M12_09250 [Deltaproteobacteria bacterium]|nr:hypothetical protein [Deltaproteobacteria bacterium]
MLRCGLRIAACAAVLWAGSAFAADPTELCIYQDDQGKIVQVNSRSRVPASQRDKARCFSQKESTYLAKPEEIELKGTVRKEEMVSALGPIEVRWPRKVETLFGRTPQRAVAEAANAVSRALKSNGFPPSLQTLKIDWKIVFMDEDVPEKQIPSYLVNNCHPAWMTPPANLYVVAQRAAAGCGGQKVRSSEADARLTQILIHEMGHAIEYQLLKDKFGDDRMRAEGFASWFEQFGSDYTSAIPKGSVHEFYLKAAQASLRQSPNVFSFSGSLEDYARASLFFEAIQSRRGVRGIVEVYSTMVSDSLPFPAAVQKRLGWDAGRMQSEVARVAQ